MLQEMSLKQPQGIMKFRDFVRNNPGKSMNDINNQAGNVLVKYGWKWVGDGISATVWKHPQYPGVLKIFEKDTGYLRWWNWCRANQNNKHVPKFKGSMTNVTDRVYGIRIEELKPANMFDFARFEKEESMWVDQHMHPDIDKDSVAVFEYVFNQNKSRNLDVHQGNIMMRGDTWVLTDPFYDR